MKKLLLLLGLMLVGFWGICQNVNPYFIKYQTPDGSVYLNTQSVSNIHIDVDGHELIHDDGTEWSPLSDIDTVYIFRNFDVPTQADWIDLGLPSGLLWAARNVGAATPEDYGDYFAWAETQPRIVFNWSLYQYTCNNNDNGMTKYCSDSNYGCNGFTDKLTTLQSVDDAATAIWGFGARMPTKEEWQELVDHCTSIWITQNGVNGQLFTGPNGNTLFLPAAGFYWQPLSNVLLYAGYQGAYWSSSLNESYPVCAWYFVLEAGYTSVGSCQRAYGYSARAVRSMRQN